MWPATSVNTRLPSVPMLKKDGTPVKDAKGKPRRRRPSVWLDKYRPVEQMTWAPGEPLTIDGRLIAEGGWIERPGVTTFNLYRPPVVQQGNAANADRWLELVERLYPGDVEHIVTFCAHRIQYPAVKINHGLILSGAPGIGKDTILEPLKLGVGAWNFKEVSPQDIMGPHNDYMRCVVLRISEVRDLGEVNRYAFYEHMKSILATPPDVMRVNAKYIPQHYVVNVAGVILTTNHRFDGIYLPPDDRRHYVAGTDIKSTDFVNGFWPSFWGWYKAGGLADVVAYLSEYDLSKFDPKAPPKKDRCVLADCRYRCRAGGGRAGRRPRRAGRQGKRARCRGQTTRPDSDDARQGIGRGQGGPVRVAERPQEPPRDPAQVRGLRLYAGAQLRREGRAVGHRRQAAGGVRAAGCPAERADRGSREAQMTTRRRFH